ncbi:Protein of unknown function [Propionibacterium freudenreichii subsp. freudenreichii]|jgi:ribosome biogenesis protein BMS1
MFS